MTTFLRFISFLFFLLFFNFSSQLAAQTCAETQFVDATDIGGGQFELEFYVCFPNPGITTVSGGVVIVITGANIVSASPAVLTNSSNTNTINSTITGGTIAYGDFSNPFSSPFIGNGDLGECMTIFVTVDGLPTDWQIYGQNYNSSTNMAECDESGKICLADAGTLTSPSDGDIFCFDDLISGATDFTASTSLEINTTGADPCIGYGFWVQSDPLGVYTTLSGIGSPPSGGLPNSDPNYAGVIVGDGTFGSPANISPIGNGATFFMAPITLPDCTTLLLSENDCVDIGEPISITYIAEITNLPESFTCIDLASSEVEISFQLVGGLPQTDPSDNYSVNVSTGNLTTPSGNTSTVFTIDGVFDGDFITLDVVDGNGCTFSFDIGPVDANSICECPTTLAGDISVMQVGSGATQNNNGVNVQEPFLLCYNDVINLSALENGAPPISACTDPCSYFGNTNGVCQGAGFAWAIHNAPPSSDNPFDPASLASNFIEVSDYQTGDWAIINNDAYLNTNSGTIVANSTGNLPTNNTIYAIISTMDYLCCPPGGGGTCQIDYDFDGDDCVDLGVAIPIVFLKRIGQTHTEDCGGVTIELSGGSPEFFPDSYNITNTGPGTLSQATVQFGNTFRIDELANGDNWSIDVTDSNGCPENFSGTFNGIPDLNFSIQPTFCAQDGATPLSASPSTANSFFSGPGVTDLMDGSTPTFDPQLIGVGTHDIVYHYGECNLTTVQQVMVNAAPVAILSGGGNGCAGNPSDIFIEIIGGVGPYEVTYKIDGVEQPPINLPSPGVETIPPTIQGLYTLCLIDDQGSPLCDGTGSGEALIILEPLPMVNNNIYIYSCINSGEFDLTEPPCDDPPSCNFSGFIDLDGNSDNDIVYWEDWDFTVEPGVEGGFNDITNESNYSPPGGCGSNIYAQVIDPSTGCFTIATVTLHCVSPLEITTPDPNDPPIMINCGDNLDLQLVFDSTMVDPNNYNTAVWTSTIPDGMGGTTNGPSDFGTNIIHPNLDVEGLYTYNIFIIEGLTENCDSNFDIEVIVSGCSMGCIDWDETPIDTCGLTYIEPLVTDALGGTWATITSPMGATAIFSEIGNDALITVSECGEYAFEYTINNTTCQDLDTLFVNFENNEVVNLEINCTASLDYCPIDCHPDPPMEDCPDNTFTLVSPGGPPAAIWDVSCIGSCDGIASAMSSSGGKQSTFFDGTTFDETTFLAMFDISNILIDLETSCPIEASCFSTNGMDDCIIESTTTTNTLDVPVLLGGAWTVSNGTDPFIPFNTMNQALVTAGGNTYEVTLSPSADTWSPVDVTVFQMNGGVPEPIMNAVDLQFLWDPDWGTEQITQTVTEYEIDPNCTGCANGYTITLVGPTMPTEPPYPCSPVSVGFGPNACDETYTQACDDNNPCTEFDEVTLAVCDNSVCLPCAGTQISEPTCDDNDCSNGIEVWNPATCVCDVTPSVLGCTDITACNFDPTATCNDGSCTPAPTCNTNPCNGDIEIIDPNNPCDCIVTTPQVLGCTNNTSCNFNPNANCDDNSCIPLPTCNTDPCIGDVEIVDPNDICSCIVVTQQVLGCTNNASCNFDPAANCDNGSCLPVPVCNTDPCNGDIEMIDPNNPCNCIVTTPQVLGCTNLAACNYNPVANCDDGNCILITTCDTDPCTNGGTYIWDTNDCMCVLDVATINGCTNPSAPNYDATANCDDGSCDCTPDGCIDPNACNFDPNATCPDGSCIFETTCDTDPCTNGGTYIWSSTSCNCVLDMATVDGCTNPASCNFDINANCDDGSCLPTPICNTDPCIGDLEIIDPNNSCNCIVTDPQELGCMDPSACNYNPNANCPDGSCIFETTCDNDPCTNGGIYIWDATACSCLLDEATIIGCTDSASPSFNPNANCSDPSACDCQPDGCTDASACNFDPTATCPDGSCIYETTCDTDPCTNGGTYSWSPVNCNCVLDIATIDGCTDPLACNFDPNANCNDGSCILPDGCTNPTACNFDPNATCDDGTCILPDGCTDPTANNFDPNATCDDGSCTYDCTPDGCTNPLACNFDPNATCDDGTCILPDGCTDPTACNFDPNATCNDGSCIFETVCDDGVCENGLEIWNPNTCQCDAGVQPAEFNVTIDEFICNGSNSMYNLEITIAGGVAPYVVTEMNNLNVTSANGVNFVIENIASGTGVTITVEDTEGCTTNYTSISHDCNCNAIDPPSGVQSVSYCAGDSTPSFIANDPGAGFEIQWYDASGMLVNTGMTYIPPTPITPGVAETYGVAIIETATNCASEIVFVDILQVQLPAAIIFQDSATLDCIQSTYEILTQVSPGTYEWTGPDNEDLGAAQTITVTQLGTYTLTVYEAILGCASQDSILIIDNQDFPMLVIADPAILDCDTDQINLSGAGSQGSPTINNYWIGPGPNGPLDTISFDLDAIATQAGVYTLYGFDSNNNCVNQQSVTVVSDYIPPIVDAGELITMDCDMSPVNLSGSISDPLVTYSWSGPNNFAASILDPVTETPGIYYLSAFNPNNGCTNVDSVLVEPNTSAISAFDLNLQEPECFDEEDGFISVLNIEGGTPPYTYSLDGVTYFTEAQFFDLGAGAYTVYIQDSDGCLYEEPVTIDQPDQILIDLGPDITIHLGDSLIVTSNVNTIYDSISWSGSDLIDCDTCPAVALTPQISTQLTATIYNGDCEATDEVTIFVDKERLVYLPTSFTPNGDGVNDLFTLYAGTGAERVIELSIFDRWGEIVYSAQNFIPNDQTIGWDGKYNGKYLNPGVFVYMVQIEFSDGKVEVFTGDIALMR